MIMAFPELLYLNSEAAFSVLSPNTIILKLSDLYFFFYWAVIEVMMFTE